MKLNSLTDISYEMLSKRFRNLSRSTFVNDTKDKIDIVQVNPNTANSSRVTSDLYIFKNGKLISRDINLITKDGFLKKIETDIFPNGEDTIVEICEPNSNKIIKKTYEKIITTLGEMRAQRDGAFLMDLWDKIMGRKINKKAPVIITRLTTNQIGKKGFETPHYTILIKGNQNKIKIDSTKNHGCAIMKDKKNSAIDMLGLVHAGDPDEYQTFNRIFNYFIKKHKNFQ